MFTLCLHLVVVVSIRNKVELNALLIREITALYLNLYRIKHMDELGGRRELHSI